jgi:hypothetical protein
MSITDATDGRDGDKSFESWIQSPTPYRINFFPHEFKMDFCCDLFFGKLLGFIHGRWHTSS